MCSVEEVLYGGRRVAGFGLGDVVVPAAAAASATSPIAVAIASGAAVATTGWVLESVRRSMRGKRR